MSPAGHARRVHRLPPTQAGSRETGQAAPLTLPIIGPHITHHSAVTARDRRSNNGERALLPYVPRRGLRDQLDELCNEAAVRQGKDLGRSRSVAAVRQVRGPKPGMNGWQLLGMYR
jgi:hypothetical protein